MEHIKTVEIDFGDHRMWSQPMPESRVDAFIDCESAYGNDVSDIDCHVTCWCCEWNK